MDQAEVDSRFFAIITDLIGTPRELVDDSNSLAAHLRANGDPGAHTYNGSDYAGVEASGPIWMTNVMAAVGDRDTTLSITLDGMPNSRGEYGNWNTPETIVDAFQTAVRNGQPFGTAPQNWPSDGLGTAWEMSVVARNVRMYESSLMFDDDEPIGRPWEEIRWYSGNEEIKEVPKPDIPEIQPPKPRK
ncbi:polymorphic toxin type 27 domain-containing protein [Streptomyces sp. CA-278952]|uniref:polymorphic toxin type 27 domain-containing protein n=1 Tax=Streptomyces sp. CA-278952 TaxID=2980556 RepID=UPI003FA688F9